MPTLEQFDTFRNGDYVKLWRCVPCSKALARATGKPLDDNGFVEWPKPLQHVTGCILAATDAKRNRKNQKKSDNQGIFF